MLQRGEVSVGSVLRRGDAVCAEHNDAFGVVQYVNYDRDLALLEMQNKDRLSVSVSVAVFWRDRTSRHEVR